MGVKGSRTPVSVLWSLIFYHLAFEVLNLGSTEIQLFCAGAHSHSKGSKFLVEFLKSSAFHCFFFFCIYKLLQQEFILFWKLPWIAITIQQGPISHVAQLCVKVIRFSPKHTKEVCLNMSLILCSLSVTSIPQRKFGTEKPTGRAARVWSCHGSWWGPNPPFTWRTSVKCCVNPWTALPVTPSTA